MRLGQLLRFVPLALLAFAACESDPPLNQSELAPAKEPDSGVDSDEEDKSDAAATKPRAHDADAPAPTKKDAGKSADATSRDAAVAAVLDATTSLGDGGALHTDSGAVHSDSGPEPDARAADASAQLLPKCVKQDTQVAMVGDSYINWLSHSFPMDIAELSKQSWQNQAVGGTSFATGGIGLIGLGYIPDQLDAMLATDPSVHTVIMDGGGNDVLVRDPTIAVNSCTASGAARDPACQKVVQLALDAATKTIARAASLGVRDVVYFFYPHVPANTILSDDAPNEILDYALPRAQAVCDGAEQQTGGKLRCTFVDMVPVFEGHPDYFNEDIHPNPKGSKAMADKIWQVMTDKCIGQKSPKDCCES